MKTLLLLLLATGCYAQNWKMPMAALPLRTASDTAWNDVYMNRVKPAMNLSDVTNKTVARANLGLSIVAATNNYNDLSNRPTPVLGSSLVMVSVTPVTDFAGYVPANGRAKTTLTTTQQAVANALGYGTLIPALPAVAPEYKLTT